jgi:hypothetical protein
LHAEQFHCKNHGAGSAAKHACHHPLLSPCAWPHMKQPEVTTGMYSSTNHRNSRGLFANFAIEVTGLPCARTIPPIGFSVEVRVTHTRRAYMSTQTHRATVFKGPLGANHA